MSKIKKHPVLEVPVRDRVIFKYNGQEVEGEKGYTIAAALHRAGFPVHSHSLDGRERSLECGIGKCGACEMLVDGKIRRICITKVDGVKEVREVTEDFMARKVKQPVADKKKILRTTVVIIGAGPAGLAVREEFNKYGVDNIVIDNNDKTGGQFTMQTHQFFFFEKNRFGGSVDSYSQDIGRRKYRRYLSEFYGLGSARREKGGREKYTDRRDIFCRCGLPGCCNGCRTVYAGFRKR